jgi:hypothetical protein
VSFVSDIDTLTFNVTPNNSYDFVIQFNNEKAFTRINTDTQKEQSIPSNEIYEYYNDDKNKKTLTDTIPFTIGKDNRIYIKGKINNSDSLNIIFDTGANAFAITSAIIGEKVEMKMDGETLNHGSDGSSIKQTSSKNLIKVGNLIWNDVTFSAIDYNGLNFDVVMGWVAFGGKTVEINYDKKIIVIHEKLENIPLDYKKIETAMIKGIPYIRATMTANNKDYSGWFEFDTGASRSLYLSQKFTQTTNIDYKNLEFIGTSGSSGSKGVIFKRNIYKLPKLKIGELETYQIPISIAEQDPEGIDFNDLLGNDLLKRFNAIIDFENFQIYLKPNELLHSEYKK